MFNREQNRKWIGRGAWAIADQSLFALANVLLNILLARWLTPNEYGAFAVAYSCFLFIGTFHTALLTEPLLVFGPSKYAKQARGYLALLLRGHWLLTAAGGLCLMAAGGVLYANGFRTMSQALLGLAIATPFSLLMWFVRRAAYVRFQPQLAMIASTGYLVLLLAGLIGLKQLHFVSIFSAMLILSAAGATCGFWLMRKIRRTLPEVEESVTSRPVITDHWRYGRWASPTSVLTWIPLNLCFVVLSILVNLEATGAFKALLILILPLLQANAALGSLLLPAMVLRVRDDKQFKQLLRTSLLLFATGACIYSALIGVFGKSLLQLIYGGGYPSQAGLLRVLLLIPLLDGVTVVLSHALRSLQVPRQVFWAQLTVVLFLLTVGVGATRLSGLWGATAALVVAEFVGTILLGGALLSQLKHQATAASRSGRFQKPLLTREYCN
jgi:O-antigen/teichoic acid export membrane protein